MNRGMKNKGIHFFLLASLMIGGCKLSDKKWDINMLVPLAHADLTINNLVRDSSLKKFPDSSLYLVSVQPLKSLNISNLLTVPDTSFQNTVSLKKITLGHRTLKHDITLGEVASKAFGIPASVLEGQKIVIDSISNLNLGKTPVNAQSLFTSATFIGGSLQLSVYNGFPVEITNVHFQLINQPDNTTIIDDTINTILRHGTATKSYPLTGKTLSGNLILNILNMSSPGSAPDSVLIDTTNAISITLSGSDLSVSSATAIFPAQNLINDSVDINYNLHGPLFTSFVIRSGKIRFTTTSSIPDTIHLSYSIPGAIKNGQPIDEKLIVPPATKNSTTVSDSFPLNGYSVDLKGQKGQSYNTFYNILTAHIDSTGKLESLSLADSINIFYGLFKVVPEYAVGYLGTRTYIEGPEAVPLDFFKNMSANKLTIPNLKVTLLISNGIGAPALATLKSITAVNSKTNKQIALICSKYIGVPLNIPGAADTLKSATIEFPLDNTNSNVSDLLGILPDKLLYLFNFTIDPKGNASNYNDFIYYGSTISASLNIQLPLELGIDGLVLQDTMIPNITNNIDLTRVQNGTMHITVSNSYPLSAKLQLYILDNSNKITDSLFSSSANTIPAGSPVSGNTIPGIGTLSVTLSQSQWQEIAAKKRLIMKVTLNTANKQVVKIYSNTHFTAKITGEFRYRNSTN